MLRYPLSVLAAVSWLLLSTCNQVPPSAAAASVLNLEPPPPALDPQWAALLADYDRFFRDSMRLTQTPGAAVVIVRDSQIVWLRGYGVRAWGQPDSVDAHTVFRIGSLSKGFAGVLTGLVVQDGRLGWNDLVQRHFPAFNLRDHKQAQRVQIWHLLSHTTGLPYHAFTNLIEDHYALPTIAGTYFPKAPLGGREGEFYAYQNAAFSLAGEVMLHVTGQTYSQLLTSRIFQPLGMSTASCDFSSIQNQPNHALPHFQTGAGWHPEAIEDSYYTNAAPAGGVNASAADMGQWLKLLLGQRPDLVADSTLDRVFRPVVKTDKERRIFSHWIDRDAASYALGWRVITTRDGHTLVYHGGYVNGFKAQIAFDRTAKVGICVLFNANSELSEACIPAFFQRLY